MPTHITVKFRMRGRNRELLNSRIRAFQIDFNNQSSGSGGHIPEEDVAHNPIKIDIDFRIERKEVIRMARETLKRYGFEPGEDVSLPSL